MTALTKINGFDVLPFNSELTDRLTGEPVSEAARELIGKVASTFAAAYGGEPWKESWDIEETNRHLTEFADKRRSMGFALIDSKDEVVAFILGEYEQWNYGDRFHLWEWGVRPDLQRQGIGTQLLDSTIKAAFDAGAKRIVLDTLHEAPADRVFQSRGFKQTPETKMMHLDNPNGPG